MEENYVFSFKKLCIFLLKIHFEKKNMYLLKVSQGLGDYTKNREPQMMGQKFRQSAHI